jgi:hypothetical protein
VSEKTKITSDGSFCVLSEIQSWHFLNMK